MKPIVALDFDGVLCDSVRETALSAWKAGARFWPEWENADPEEEWVRRFIRLRPSLETGHQAIFMLRSIIDGLADEDIAENLEAHCRAWREALGLERRDLVDIFGAARDQWIAHDLDSWLACHRFYPGTLPALRRCLADGEVFILTTKQERFVQALLEPQGIPLPPERIYGLDRGLKKTTILDRLGQEFPDSTLHFVEDRAATLQAALADETLEAVRLYYAAWGYGTPADLAWAKKTCRVTVWELDDFLTLS